MARKLSNAQAKALKAAHTGPWGRWGAGTGHDIRLVTVRVLERLGLVDVVDIWTLEFWYGTNGGRNGGGVECSYQITDAGRALAATL
jgi:hypothetical protein